MSSQIKTLGELFEESQKNPKVLWRSHRKVWKVISSSINGKGPEALSELKSAREKRMFGDQPSQRMRYPLFAELLDIDIDLAEIGEFFREASAGGAMEKRVLEVVGETGVGKTTWTEIIAAGMEKEDFFYLRDCPHKEHPLNAIPHDLRKKDPNSDLYYFRGQLCRKCEMRFQNEFQKKWENLPIESASYRMGAGIGMLQVEGALSMPASDNSRISEVPEDWYRVVDLANGGILFIDLPAQHADFCGRLSRMVSDGKFKDKDLTDLCPDIAVVSVSNKTIKEAFPSEKALLSRVISVKFHMALNPAAEIKIQHKDLARGERGFHFTPWVKEAGCYLLTISRLESDAGYRSEQLKLGGSDAMIFYSGGAKLGNPLETHSLKELRSKRPADGTRGIAMRESGNLLASAGQQNNCVGIGHLMTALREYGLDKKFDSETVARVKEWITLEKNSPADYAPCHMEMWYQNYAIQDMVRGLMGIKTFDKTLKDHFENYMANVEAYVDKKKIIDPSTKEELPPNEAFMKMIEKQIAIIESAADGFRRGVTSSVKNKDDFEEYPPLKEAIVKMIINEKLDTIKHAVLWDTLTAEKDKTLDPFKAKKNLDKIKENLLEAGYQPCCWENLLSYAKKIFK